MFLNQDGFVQPLQPNEQITNKKFEKSSSAEEVNESDDEAFPCSAGDEFASREEVVTAIEKIFKSDKNLLTKLTKYTQKKIFQLLGKNENNVQADDIVSEAFNKIISLKRKWYKNKVNDIGNLIIMVIISLIRIEASKISDTENQLYNPLEAGIKEHDKNKSKQKRKIIPLYYKYNENPNNDNSIFDVEKFKVTGLRDIEDQFDFEMKLDEEYYIEMLEKKLEDDELAFFVLQARLNGNRSNIEIAKDLGVDVNEIENAFKRLKRKAARL